MITVSDLSVAYDDEPVLSNVSCRIDRGEVIGLIGPNGAGKTTLLRAINGYVSPTTGGVTIGDDPVSELSARERSRRIAVVPQVTDIRFTFTVEQIVSMGRTPHRGRLRSHDSSGDDAVASAMDAASVTRFADRGIDTLSGGERQRVFIARALAQEAPVLLLDEPTAHLDINHQIETLELAAGLAEEGRTVIAAIHDLNLAARYCDRLCLLANGSAVAIGSPESVLTPAAIEDAYGTRAAVRNDPVTGAQVVSPLPGKPTHPDVPITVIGSGSLASTVIRQLDRAGYQVRVGPVAADDPVVTLAHGLGLQTLVIPQGSSADELHDSRLDRHLSAATLSVIVDTDDPITSAGAAVASDHGPVLRVTGQEERSDVEGTVSPESVTEAVAAALVSSVPAESV